MPVSRSHPAELAFLDDMAGDRGEQYRGAWWLLTAFDSDTWQGRIAGRDIAIDFRVKLDDGSLLTAPRHHALCETFKYWICVQSHPDSTGGQTLAGAAALAAVSRSLHLIDYFLLNASQFQLSNFGLGAITEGDLRRLLESLANHKHVAQSIYRWNDNLSEYLRIEGAKIAETHMEEILSAEPEIATLPSDPADRSLTLSDQELLRARAHLWANRMYRSGSLTEYKLVPNTLKLATLLYPNTLRGMTSRPLVHELQLAPADRYRREIPAVPIRTGTGTIRTDKSLQLYVATLRTLGLLADIGLPIPPSALEITSDKGFLGSLSRRGMGRTRTLPSAIVLSALRSAIEFTLEYGDDLVHSYLNLVRAAIREGVTCGAYVARFGIEEHLSQKLQDLGVRTWHLSQHMANIEWNVSRSAPRPASNTYFERMRSGEGLWELLRILYGAIEITVGTLMARRVGELTDLIAGKCLDKSKSYLIFRNRKSGAEGVRDEIARPIPPIASRFILLLEHLQAGLVEIGALDSFTTVFSSPDRFGIGLRNADTAFADTVDIFCDYFQTQLDDKGRRYYIRQHQLRRFFAILFFWGRSFGGMDTLRWFLGHTDVEHLYHYITESTPGEILQSVKATFALEQVLSNSDDSAALADLLASHYGTRNFAVLDAGELDAYVQDLIESGSVTVEPEFFLTPNGQSFRVLILIKGVADDL